MAHSSACSEAYVILSLYGQRIGKVSFSRRVHGTALVAQEPYSDHLSSHRFIDPEW